MKKFNPGMNLHVRCLYIINKACYENKKKLNEYKIDELARRLEEDLNKYAEKVFKEEAIYYLEEIINPEKLFYLSGGKDWGFCKEFLEIETVKKYKDSFLEIIKKEQEIEELNQTVKVYTKNNYKNFRLFYLRAQMNRTKKIIFNIAKKEIINKVDFYIQYVKDNYLR